MIYPGEVREHLYQKYIEPTKKKKEQYIGIEIELPIVNLDKKAVDFEHVHAVTALFLEHFGFRAIGWDDEGNIYSAQENETGDILSYDCSYNNLELSLGRGKELHSLYCRFCRYYEYLQEQFGIYHYTLTGMGVNPYRQFNHNVPIENGRYRMLFHHLASYKNYDIPMYFHPYPAFGTFSSASQAQLDVTYEDVLTTLNAFSRLEPIKALLFGNSLLLDVQDDVVHNEREDLLCCRDMFWENSTHGINPHNVGMIECHLDTMEDLMAYIETTSIYCVERGDKYINFPPVCIMDYFKMSSVRGEYYQDGEYHEIEVIPQIEDIEYLRTFKFEDLTFRGTVEFRSVCCQPISDCMSVAAFHVGLKQKVYELNAILENDHVIFHHGYNRAELRKLFVKKNLPGFVEDEEVYALTKHILELAREGLRERGYGEEIFLDVLFERLDIQENPSQRLLREIREGVSLEDVIMEYANLKRI